MYEREMIYELLDKTKGVYTINGWVFIKQYGKRYKLWQRITSGVRECFLLDEIPEEYM